MKPVTVVLIVALSAPPAAQDSDRTRAEALAERATARLRVLQEEADRLASDARTLLGDLRRLDVERQIRTEELRQADVDAQATVREIAAIDAEVRRLEAETATERPQLNARLVELYKLGQGRYLRLMLSVSDARRLRQASRTAAALSKRDRDGIAAHQRRLKELAASRRELETRGDRLAAARAAADRARIAAGRAAEDRNALVRDIDRQRDLNAQLAGELQVAQQQLQARLKDLDSDGRRTDPPSLPLRPFRGDLDWPAAGAIRQRFGQSASPASPPSNGIEISAPEGVPVHAVHDGLVAFAGPFAGYGTLVILDHGNQTFSLYGSLLEARVAEGARIDRGQPVGSAGSTVLGATGLYFELRVDGRPVDPLQWLKKR